MTTNIKSKRARIDDLYNDPDLICIVKCSDNETMKFRSLTCISIMWGMGYSTPGIKLGPVRSSPPYTKKETNKNGLYTEVVFLQKWDNKDIRVFNNEGIELIH